MIKKIFKHNFIKKITLLFSGSIIVSVISLLSFFVVAKLYTTDTLGNYYVFLSIIAITTAISTFGYLHSIPLLDDSEAEDMYSSIFLFASLIAFIISPIIIYFSQNGVFVVFVVLLNIYFKIVEQSFVREQRIKELNIIRIGRLLISFSFIISSFFIFGDKLEYLIYMYVFSLLLFNIFLKNIYMKDFNIIRKVRIKNKLIKYNKFPKFIGPGMIFHEVAYQIPILVAGTYFSPSVAANYNMAFKLVFTPATLVSGVVSQVYIGELSKKYREGINIFSSLKKLSIVLMVFGILFIFGISVILPSFVNYFFDKQWNDSIDISMALLPLIFSLIVISPLANLFQFTNNQKYILKVHLFSMLIAGFSFALAVYMKDYLLGVKIFAILMFIRYIFLALKLKGLYNDAK